MMKWLQKLGKALMLPVAALPVCGILMGIGYALAPAVMGAEGPTTGAAYTIGFLLVKAGGALIDNMAWLFAIGAAVGLADDHDGTAGLAGLVSFLMMQQLLSPGVVGTIRAAVGSTLEEGTVDYIAFSKIAGNSFIGILAAVIGATCYNKFKSTKLPDWLAFFSGKRSVAIMTALVSIVVSVILLFVWPVIFGILVALGNGIAGLSGIGAGIYAFLNRLLIPTGLHHALNNVFWFDTIGLGDLNHFWAGETSADVGWEPWHVHVRLLPLHDVRYPRRCSGYGQAPPRTRRLPSVWFCPLLSALSSAALPSRSSSASCSCASPCTLCTLLCTASSPSSPTTPVSVLASASPQAQPTWFSPLPCPQLPRLG